MRWASADRTEMTLFEKFQNRPEVQQELTGLARSNSRLKVKHWLHQFDVVSVHGKYVTPRTKRELREYAATRPPQYATHPDLEQLVANVTAPQREAK